MTETIYKKPVFFTLDERLAPKVRADGIDALPDGLAQTVRSAGEELRFVKGAFQEMAEKATAGARHLLKWPGKKRKAQQKGTVNSLSQQGAKKIWTRASTQS